MRAVLRRRVAFALLALAAASSVAAQRTLTAQSDVRGELRDGDGTLNSGEYVDTYVLRGRAGQRVSIRMTADAFDPYLLIRGPGDFSEENDDVSESDRAAELEVRLPADGEYRIMATSYEAGESGAYRLALGGTGGNEPSARTAPAAQSGDTSIAPGQSRQGELSEGDETLDSGEYRDFWTLRGRRGQRFIVRMSSSSLDSYLLVRGPGGLSEDNDDDASSRGARNSRVEFAMPADGEVRIGATSYEAGETGRYALSVEEVGSRAPVQASAPAAAAASAAPAGSRLVLGRAVSGRLAQGDPQLRSGEYEDAFTLSGRRGERVELRLSSSDFDPYVQVTGPGDFAIANDDDPAAPDSRDSRLVVTLPADGNYRVGVTSYASGETGAYRLQALAPGATGERAQTIALGNRTSGTLSQGDDSLHSGRFVDRYRFTGRSGQRVALELASTDFDSYMMLIHPGGGQEVNDDIEENRNTNSRLEVELPEDGEYVVQVTSYRPRQTGSYQFSIVPGAAAERPSRDGRNIASLPGGQRVYAIMVGVSEYGGRAEDLPYTADDATKLAQTLRRAGVLNPASVVLTDGGATRAALRSAFQRVAAQAGPEDLFLFFFSGHGNQVSAVANSRELDGRSETIELRDGALSDQELGQMFQQIRAGRSMIVLDSCFSGGFDNIIDRPGIMGLFSSEEDLTSLVAEKFRSGGYLSHFLRAGLSGEADDDRDRLITAGEITAYVRRQFRSQGDLEAETREGNRNYQNLVVHRGGVRVDDVLLRLGATS